MFQNKDGSADSNSRNGVPTPSTTPPPAAVTSLPVASPAKPATMKADVDEGDSPKVLPMEPADKIKIEELSQGEKTPDAEDKDEDSKERENDIYSEAVLACSIENPESCVMCSG
ncbi:Ribonucleoside-diphosphate reductase large chain like protein [Verticillium longisporum]|nr:Ribonucleoside-diphosphate reductase large chain like protein [Verticillium longisporum]